MLNTVAEDFSTVLKAAVLRANTALGVERVHYLDRRELFRSGEHELCGGGEDWINGIAVNRDDTREQRLVTSFHPNGEGHAATAASLAEMVERTFPRTAPVTGPPLGLGGTLGDLEVFAAEDTAVTLVTGELGQPDSDSGWIPPECGPVGDVRWRLVRWGALELLFTDGPIPQPDGFDAGVPTPHLAGWTYRADNDSIDPRLVTADGPTIGSTRSEVQAAFPGELEDARSARRAVAGSASFAVTSAIPGSVSTTTTGWSPSNPARWAVVTRPQRLRQVAAARPVTLARPRWDVDLEQVVPATAAKARTVPPEGVPGRTNQRYRAMIAVIFRGGERIGSRPGDDQLGVGVAVITDVQWGPRTPHQAAAGRSG